MNSVVSTNGAKFFTLDIKNFYFNTPMERFECMILKMEEIPENVIEKYELKAKKEDGQVYVEIRKGMYGLPQAGILAQKLLEKRLKINDTTNQFTHLDFLFCRHPQLIFRKTKRNHIRPNSVRLSRRKGRSK